MSEPIAREIVEMLDAYLDTAWIEDWIAADGQLPDVPEEISSQIFEAVHRELEEANHAR